VAGLAGIDLNLLVAFGAVLEERNLTRAGERIGMTQPAMSGALARLRKHFDDDLLVRVGREYELTPLAVKLLPIVQEALRQVEQTFEPSGTFDPLTSDREFTVGLSDYALTVLTGPLLEALRTRAPEVRLRFDPMIPPGAEMDSYLLRSDLLITALGFGAPGRRQMLFRDRFVCVVDKGNPALRDGRLSMEAIERLPHATVTFGPGTTTPVERLLDDLGVKRRVEVTCQGLLPLPFVVSGTSLVAFVPARLARRCDESLGLVIAEVPFAAAELVEGVHWHPTRSADPALRWLLGVLREVGEQISAE
jgi:DNA-binding transcriptional LysR family regulator